MASPCFPLCGGKSRLPNYFYGSEVMRRNGEKAAAGAVVPGPGDARGRSAESPKASLRFFTAALMLLSNSTTAILQGFGAGVTDLLFHYPNQVASSAASPNVCPYTILVKYRGTKIARSTVTNAYDFLMSRSAA